MVRLSLTTNSMIQSIEIIHLSQSDITYPASVTQWGLFLARNLALTIAIRLNVIATDNGHMLAFHDHKCYSWSHRLHHHETFLHKMLPLWFCGEPLSSISIPPKRFASFRFDLYWGISNKKSFRLSYDCYIIQAELPSNKKAEKYLIMSHKGVTSSQTWFLLCHFPPDLWTTHHRYS